MKKYFFATTLLAILVIAGGYVYVKNINSKTTTTNTSTASTTALSVEDILNASYVISANSIGEIPTEKVVFPAHTNNDDKNLTGNVFIYQDGTVSTNLVSGKDYEYFSINNYEFNADHSEATVYITGNFAGEKNDNRVFSIQKIDGNVITKEQASDSQINEATTTACTSDTGKVMTYAKALLLAKTSSCAKIGTFTGEYSCNQNAGGLVDVYMKPTNSPNCAFACRISIDTGKAEEGWMCTGLKQ